jgi:hypothetical protein
VTRCHTLTYLSTHRLPTARPSQYKPACPAANSPWKSVGECQQYTKTLCAEIENCPIFAGLAGVNERLAALEAALAKEKADPIAAVNAEREERIAAIEAEAQIRADEDAAIRVRSGRRRRERVLGLFWGCPPSMGLGRGYYSMLLRAGFDQFSFLSVIRYLPNHISFSAKALLPTADRYEGANAGTLSVGGGEVENVLTQVLSFPSATSTAAPNGVDQVRAC